jgi:hypothetical protein
LPRAWQNLDTKKYLAGSLAEFRSKKDLVFGLGKIFWPKKNFFWGLGEFRLKENFFSGHLGSWML